MKKTEAIAVGDILRLYIDMGGNTDEFDRRKIEYAWADIVGPDINRATVSRRVQGDVLHVHISSAPLKNELTYATQPLVKALNEAVGKQIINKIVFH